MPYSPFQQQGYGNPYFTTAASRAIDPFQVGAQTQTSSFGGNTNINTTAGSRSINPFGIGSPDLSYADPNTLGRLNISNLIYSPNAGGYLYEGRNYSGMGSGYGGDPSANRQASQFYNYLGNLPTMEPHTPALERLYQAGYAQPPPPGPSLNTYLSDIFNSASPFQRNVLQGAGFSPTFTGPFRIGRY